MTPIQQSVYTCIIYYKMENDGNAPTLREICDECKISSTSKASQVLCDLAEAGLIRFSNRGKFAKGRFAVVGGRWLPPGTLAHEKIQTVGGTRINV